MSNLVVVKGGGDIASGIVHRLHQSNFDIVILEIAKPTVVRRGASFAQAIIQDSPVMVEGITAKVAKLEEVPAVLADRQIPILLTSDPFSVQQIVAALTPRAMVDAIIAKRNMGTQIADAPIVIGVGPGFMAGVDVHAVIETMRGHDLGRVIYQGTAIKDTGIPGEVGGFTTERLIRAPIAGRFTGCREIGDTVAASDVVGYVGDTPVTVSIAGILRGLLQPGLEVEKGMKLGDVDPRCRREHCYTISDKARAIGGGVLEAILHLGGKR